MHCVEGLTADAEGVRFEWVLRVRTGFSRDIARIRSKFWRGEENRVEHGPERGTEVSPPP